MFCNLLNLPELSTGMGGAGTMLIVGTLPKSTGEWFGLDLDLDSSSWQLWLNSLPSISALEKLYKIAACVMLPSSWFLSTWLVCLKKLRVWSQKLRDDWTTWRLNDLTLASLSFSPLTFLPFHAVTSTGTAVGGSSWQQPFPFPISTEVLERQSWQPPSLLDKCFTLQKLRRIHIYVTNITSRSTGISCDANQIEVSLDTMWLLRRTLLHWTKRLHQVSMQNPSCSKRSAYQRLASHLIFLEKIRTVWRFSTSHIRDKL